MPAELLDSSQTSFKQSKERLFWIQKWSKWPFQRTKICPQIEILGVIYQHFELKTHPKVDLLRQKIIPKQLLDNSKTTFKKSKIDYLTLKMVNICQNDHVTATKMCFQNIQIWVVIKNFLGPILQASIGLLITKAKAKYFESNFQTTLKKSKFEAKIRLSRPPVTTCEIVQLGFQNRILFI